ncbi:MAG: DegT/DnrJ/EryC1/StrS family aminotransferase [Dehalococcoidales bacterium]|jgi:perosamine synthetase|nr:DegT/DnrJ/EryC1/StrS family aminotransferase [Dehalococcoidales bacterium]
MEKRLKQRIPLFNIYWDEEDLAQVSRVIRRGTYWTCGPDVTAFENSISRYLGCRYCVAFNSGTSALHAALLACGIGPGDEVIVPSFTFIATANAPLFVGARPVFADIEDSTYGLDPEDVRRKITPRTRAILPIHYAGCPCKIYEILEIAREHNLLLIEDAAEAFGAKVQDRMIGTFGDAAIFSFCQNKIITTGEGGAVVTDNHTIYEKLKLIRSHGRLDRSDYFSSDNFDYVSLGYNFRLPDIAAALGISQLNKVDQLIEMRRANAKYLNNRLSSLEMITIPAPPDSFFHVYQMYSISIKGDQKLRDSLITYLGENGISCKVNFHPVHLTSYYRQNFGYSSGELPVTESVSARILTLPMFPGLSREDMDYTCEHIKIFFN